MYELVCSLIVSPILVLRLAARVEGGVEGSDNAGVVISVVSVSYCCVVPGRALDLA